jgi:lysyl-tRNA synthetase class II
METSILSAIVAAIAAIAGGGVAAAIQMRLARINNSAQLELQSHRLQEDLVRTELESLKRQIVETHKAVSHISRNFSITALDIHWRAGMQEETFDQHYMAISESMDEIRAVADLYLPSVSGHIEAMHSEMNIFWGNFKELLRLSQLNEPYERQQPVHQKSIEAARAIASYAHRAKAKLTELAGHRRLRGD